MEGTFSCRSKRSRQEVSVKTVACVKLRWRFQATSFLFEGSVFVWMCGNTFEFILKCSVNVMFWPTSYFIYENQQQQHAPSFQSRNICLWGIICEYAFTHAHTGGSSFLAHLNADEGIVVVQWDFVLRVHRACRALPAHQHRSPRRSFTTKLFTHLLSSAMLAS